MPVLYTVLIILLFCTGACALFLLIAALIWNLTCDETDVDIGDEDDGVWP